MKKRFCLLAALVCGAAVNPRAAAGQAADSLPRNWPPPPIIALLGQREHLALTSQQVAALDSIASVWSSEDERANPAGTVMTTSPIGVNVSRGRARARTPESSANNFRAARAVEQVLTDTQRQAVCALNLRPTDTRDRSRPVWPWCAEATASH